ncbi:hypothetical protein AAFF_G00176690 [Aldrovandia affinis]|uniref:TNFR-Cys domain-containing protein n=1 Tax=Aldrovandia affinis TaxID=143900 RepID=A0AAD7R0B6_9TELE|nr:hypothetical protein AAFF_G00176690 [Aldrovandia affinis]
MALWVCHTYALLSMVIALSIEKQCGPAEYKTEAGECCAMCRKGLVVHKDCISDSSTTCIPCMRGTYMNEPNGLYSCRPCKTCDPGQGLRILHKCTSTSDTFCDVKDGFHSRSYSDNKECNFALKHSSCLPGQRPNPPGTKATDAVCEECPYGHFSQYGINCMAWMKCTFEQKMIQDGTPTNDTTPIQETHDRCITDVRANSPVEMEEM